MITEPVAAVQQLYQHRSIIIKKKKKTLKAEADF